MLLYLKYNRVTPYSHIPLFNRKICKKMTTAGTNGQGPELSGVHKSLRWGIIAAGNISNDFVCALKYHAKQEGKMNEKKKKKIFCVAARNLEKAQEFADKHGIEKAFDNYDDVFVDNPNVDVVYIGSIHPVHYELTLKALQNKKHVICEKPLGMNLKQVQKMISTAKENNCFLMEAIWTRHFPLLKKIREMVLGGENGENRGKKVIGDVLHLTADFGLEYPKDATRIWDLELGGGALLDVGIYPISYIPWIFKNETTEIRGELEKSLQSAAIQGELCDKTGVDLYGSFGLKFGEKGEKREKNENESDKNSPSALITWSGICQTPEEVTICGTKGYIRIHSPGHIPTKATLYLKDSRGFKEVEILDEKSKPFELPPFDDEFVYPGSQGLLYEIVETEKCIKEGKLESSHCHWSDSIAIAKMMDTIRENIGLKYPADLQ